MRCATLFVVLGMLAGCDAIERHPMVPSERYDPLRGAAVAVAIHAADTAARVAQARSDAPLAACRRRLPSGPASIATTITVTMKRQDSSVGRWTLTQHWRRDVHGAESVSRQIDATRPDGRPSTRRWEARHIAPSTWVGIDDQFADTSREPTLPARIQDLAFSDVDALLTQINVVRGAAAVAEERGICGAVQRDPLWPPLRRVGLRLGERERIAWFQYENQRGRMIVEVEERWRPVADAVIAPEVVADIDEDLTYATVNTWLEDGVAAGWLVSDDEPLVGDESTEGANAAGDGDREGSAPSPVLGVASGSGDASPHAP